MRQWRAFGTNRRGHCTAKDEMIMQAAVSKYNNRRIQTEDGWFDSQRELRRWQELKLLEKAGQILNLRRQVKFELIPKEGSLRAIKYVADFVYEEKGKQVVEDSKGF